MKQSALVLRSIKINDGKNSSDLSLEWILISTLQLNWWCSHVADWNICRWNSPPSLPRTIAEFWISIASDHRCRYEEVSKVILPFPSTHLCEAGFSTLPTLKAKNRSRLEGEDDLRVKLTAISARIEKLCKERFKPTSTWLRISGKFLFICC